MRPDTMLQMLNKAVTYMVEFGDNYGLPEGEPNRYRWWVNTQRALSRTSQITSPVVADAIFLIYDAESYATAALDDDDDEAFDEQHEYAHAVVDVFRAYFEKEGLDLEPMLLAAERRFESARKADDY